MNDESSSLGFGLSSRMKKIYIELHDYFFFHGPSEIKKIDKRFIGRKRIKDKLKSILTGNDTRSGAYLITGYRGMGKSSFVSKVFDEIDSSKRVSVLAPRYIRILVLILLLSLFKLNTDSILSFVLYIFLPLIAFGFSSYYLILSDKNIDDLQISNTTDNKLRKGFSLKSRFLRSFILPVDVDAENTFRRQTQVVFLTFLIHLVVAAITTPFGEKLGYLSRLVIYITLFTIVSIVNYIYQLIQNEINNNPQKTSQLFFLILKKIKAYFNYSRRIYIKVNLGYDDLKEIDILRLISRNIEKEYKSFKRFSLQHIFTSALKIFFIFFFVGVLYYFEPIYNLNYQLKEKTGFNDCFPSQDRYILEDESNCWEELISNITGKNILKDGIKYIDAFIYISYRKLIDVTKPVFNTIKMNKFISIRKLHHTFQILPGNFDYFFLMYFILFYLILKYFVPRLLGVVSDYEILKELKKLNESISFHISEEQGNNLGISTKFAFNFFKRRKRSLPQADIREIEKRLIEILEMFDKYNRFSIKPEFICIFDELDKIEPHENINIMEKEEELQSFDKQLETTFFATEGVRRRQHTIFKILSNLKHFLNTAKAKFIFIAGREIYDAALADVSDRNFFIGSIFHDVIYVHSFLTDASDYKASNLSSMTEKYVCQFLFPQHYHAQEFSLKEYKKYLELFFDENTHNSDWEGNLRDKKIEKIITTLRNFITYLTYRSNGAPKKITTYFENYIFKPNFKKSENGRPFISEFSLCVGFSTKNFYLEIGYYDQYTFGMISYLVNPVILAVSKSIKNFGDKLLVSTSFLVDHLYKFHKNAFSWRNIELTPEILDINKAPQLRDLISLIIQNLSNSHLTEIVSGLYDFKFRKKISEEISFLSKISEREAAAFNFTLDESLSLKKHHKELLKEIKSNHKNSIDKSVFINAISFIHMIIGDLYFYDEEYNEAIVEYMEAIEDLRNQNFNANNASYFILLIRNMLKLGYSLEKRKSHISAFMIYSQLVSYIVKYRNIDLSVVGIEEKIITKKDLKIMLDNKSKRNKLKIVPSTDRLKYKIESEEMTTILVKSDEINENVDLTYINNKIITKTSKSSNFKSEIELNIFNRKKDIPLCLSDDFVELVNISPFSPIKENLIYNISAFEGIRLIYQPLIAKVHMIEKSHLGGITYSDLIRVENEYNFITKITKYREKRLIAAEFWCKIGDILFFKNGLVPKVLYKTSESNGQKYGKKDYHYCCKQNQKNPHKFPQLCSENLLACQIVSQNGHTLPCRACEYYMRSLRFLCIDYLEFNNSNLKEDLFFFSIYFNFKKKLKNNHNSMVLSVFANTLAGVGNSFFSCCSNEILPKPNFFERLLKFIESPKYCLQFFTSQNQENKMDLSDISPEENEYQYQEFNKFEEVFICYFFSYLFFLSVDQNKEASVQMLKLLYLIRNIVRIDEEQKNIVRNMLDIIKKTIVMKGIKNLYRAYGNIHRLEIEDYKNVFNYSLEDNDDININNISLSANLKEIIIIFEEIKIICGDNDFFKNPYQFPNIAQVTPYSNINRMYNRIIELKFKVTVNYKIFSLSGLSKIIENLNGKFFGVNIVEDRILQLLFKEKIDTKILDQSFNFKNVVDTKEKIQLGLEFLIIDSIFCLHEIIKIIGIYGISYMVNYSMLANAHKRMAEWCDFYFSYFRNSFPDKKNRIYNDLKKLIEEDNVQYIGTNYHYEKAREALYSILELHGEGKAYKNMLEKMFYLNDDYDDAVYHFNAAAERFRINSGVVKNELKEVKEKLTKSSLLKYDKYISIDK